MPKSPLIFKRERRSLCNICKTQAVLSWDHVPPKGSITLQSVEQETLFQHLVKSQERPESMIAQNGVKYRTICEKCNNWLLGKKYDPYFIEFSNGVGSFLKSNLAFPQKIPYRCKPLKIIRALLGHILSAKSEIDAVTYDEIFRGIVLDEMQAIPDNIKVYYWIYPYNSTVIVRDIMIKDCRYNESAIFVNLLKFFPIAYLITDKQSNLCNSLNELTVFKDLSPDADADVEIDFSSIKPYNWPESVDDNTVIFGGKGIQNSIYARPRVR